MSYKSYWIRLSIFYFNHNAFTLKIKNVPVTVGRFVEFFFIYCETNNLILEELILTFNQKRIEVLNIKVEKSMKKELKC